MGLLDKITGDSGSKNSGGHSSGGHSGGGLGGLGGLGGSGGGLGGNHGGGHAGGHSGGGHAKKNDDMLDKGIDLFQEKVLKQGDQSNESAHEQQKDQKIADFVRSQYKSQTGKEFPIKEKHHK